MSQQSLQKELFNIWPENRYEKKIQQFSTSNVKAKYWKARAQQTMYEFKA